MRALTLLRVALVAFVVVWLFGPYALRSAVPAWLVFLIALGLELNFFLGAMRPAPAPAPDRGPQPVDRERYGGVGWVVIDREAEAEPEPGLPVRQFLVGLGVIAALILLVWVVDRGTGWDALDRGHTGQGGGALLGGGLAHRGEAGRDPLRRLRQLRGRRPARRRCRAGRGRPRLPDTGPLPRPLPARVQGRGAGRARPGARSPSSPTRPGTCAASRDEGTTECYALQSGVELGERLGLSEGTARRLMLQQLTENALRRRGNLEYLVPPECKNGGRLDLNPDSGQFP